MNSFFFIQAFIYFYGAVVVVVISASISFISFFPFILFYGCCFSAVKDLLFDIFQTFSLFHFGYFFSPPVQIFI